MTRRRAELERRSRRHDRISFGSMILALALIAAASIAASALLTGCAAVEAIRNVDK